MPELPDETQALRSVSPSATVPRGPNAEDIQSHYDLPNAFFSLWQDPIDTSSCAYFQRADMTVHEAQIAKIDLSLRKLGLQPGMTLLEIGCGWGATSCGPSRNTTSTWWA